MNITPEALQQLIDNEACEADREQLWRELASIKLRLGEME